MSRRRWLGPMGPLGSESQASVGIRRDRIAAVFALLTVVFIVIGFAASKGNEFLVPGPLTSVHGTIEACSTCHTQTGGSKFNWVNGLVAPDPLADSKACMGCHKMPDTAFTAHGASAKRLELSRQRIAQSSHIQSEPLAARAQTVAFPADKILARDLYCATCHQEHQIGMAHLTKFSNEQCRSCHTAKFDSFEHDHPNFKGYPFKRRTRIIYDHAGHFGKHYPEIAKKDPTKRIPPTCSTCHNSNADQRTMGVASFEATCAGCHLEQIKGNERVSGPKGIAFLSLPSVDVETLKKRSAEIGEWPDTSEAESTPFMKLLIGGTDHGAAVLKGIEKLNLQDLTNASDDEIKAVTNYIWEIKKLVHRLITEKASTVLGRMTITADKKAEIAPAADLTTSIPRDVIVRAQQQWLPNLGVEIASGPIKPTAGAQDQNAAQPAVTAIEPTSKDGESEDAAQSESQSEPTPADKKEDAAQPKLDPPACSLRVFGQCLVSNQAAAKPNDAEKEREATTSDPATTGGGPWTTTTEPLPPSMRAGLSTLADTAEHRMFAEAPNANGSKRTADQTDDLLHPTDEELRDIQAHNKASGKKSHTANPQNAGGVQTDQKSGSQPETARGIEGTVDAEEWADFGGWYQQDYTIFYRPVGHKDKFLFSWLTLKGQQLQSKTSRLTASIFESLTHKDSPGSCVKCHSVDKGEGDQRIINFLPLSADTKTDAFTRFKHEPHLSTIGKSGCLSCHELRSGQSYLKSYEQSNPHIFTAEFKTLDKAKCTSCHADGKARQDCVLCHKYHVNEVITPIADTKLPSQ